jgi:hypothetical protein
MKTRVMIAGLLMWSGCESTSIATVAPVARLSAITTTPQKATTQANIKPAGAWNYNGLPGLEKSQFLPVIEATSASFAVLQHNPNPALFAGDPFVARLSEETLILQREVTSNLLPREISAWSKNSLTLFNAEAAICEAAIESFVVVGRVSGDTFAEEIVEAKAAPQKLPELAKQAWAALEERPDQTYLAAKLSSNNNCGGALFARSSELPRPAQAPAIKTSGSLQKEAIRNFRALGSYKAVQRAYRAGQKTFATHSSLWDGLDGASPIVSVFHVPGASPLVWVSAASGYYGCDGAIYTLEATFSLSSSEHALTPISGGEPSEPLISPIGAIDIDGDGALELLTEDGLYRLHNGIYQEWVTLRTPTFEEEFCK